ncbi:MAG: hypothetical protein HXX20_25000 [Chloroflexi bacterium]|nr:hypothetical protein [Chloroflexota bacterium]
MTDENQPTSPIDPLTIGELISLAEAAQLSGLTQDYLKKIAQSGRLRAKKIGRNWVTTKMSVEVYKNTRSHILKDV